jgi:hypothetical protein
MKGAAIAMVLAIAAPAIAEVGPPPDVASRARGAGKVVVARVLDVRGQFETNKFGDRLIMSHAVLEVQETLKGESQTIVNMVIEGGTVGDLTLRVSDLPSLESGERAVLFLDASANGEHVPHGRGKGVVMKLNGDRVAESNLSLDDVRQQVRNSGNGNSGQGGR